MHAALRDPRSETDTIIAVASAPGLSAQAVLRLSGPRALPAVAALVDPGGGALIEQRGFTGRPIELQLDRLRLPAWLNVYRAPRSYTREDVVELFVCGSPPILGLLSTALLRSPSGGDAAVRWARPGEFTLRAFLSGRIDLSQAESVASLIEATGESEARAARRGLRGELRERLERLADAVTETIALLEAALDFPDEDLPQVRPEVIGERVDEARDQLRELRSSCGRLSGADGTLRVVLAGFPNAGKSTLLNAILRREAAIATPVPGTTRDPVRGVTLHRGRRIEWVDLAGTRSAGALTSDRPDDFARGEPFVAPGDAAAQNDAGELVGREGDDLIWSIVRRLSKLEVEAADVVLWILDPLSDVDASLAECRRLSGRCLLRVVQKADLLGDPGPDDLERFAVDGPVHLVSAHQGRGVTELIDAVFAAGSGRGLAPRGEPARFLVSAHQEAALEAATAAMARAREAVAQGYEFVAADLRDGLRALEDLTGRLTSDAILDRVFSRFCIGK